MIKLEKATFIFSQDANCNADHPDMSEQIQVDFESDLGLDYSDGFFVLKTEGFSFEDEKEVADLFERCRKILNK